MSTMTPAHKLSRGMTVECPRRSSIGAHDATVTHTTRVGSGSFRMVVTLDCGHDVNMTGGHGLYVVDDGRITVGTMTHCIQIGHYGEHPARVDCLCIDTAGRCYNPETGDQS